MNKTFWNKLLGAMLASGAVLVLAAASPGTGRAADEYGEEELKLISTMTARLLSGNHYRQQPLDASLSRRLFDEYIDELDPGKVYFSEEDIARFAPDRDMLCRQLLDGDNSFAFRVYDLYRTRNNEFRAFSEKMLKEPLDFTKNESFETDRRKAARAKNRAELEKLWYLRLKNDVLSYRLLNRVQKEEAARAEAKMTEEEKKHAAAAAKWEGKSPEEKVFRRLRDINNDIVQKDKVDILGIYLNALAQVYGPHSNYNPPKIEEDFDIQMSLSLSGIGATLTSDDGYIKIVDLTPGGPAEKDGRLQVEDRIIAVAQEGGEAVDVIDMPVSKAVKLIRGPEKTKVTLTVLPGDKGRGALPETITILRDKVKLVDSEAKGEVRPVKTADGRERKVGVITLPGFYMDFDAAMRGDADYKSCSRDVRKILENFEKEKVDAVVMDLRRNGGGSLAEAITLTGLFIPSGPVVQMRTSDNRVQLKSDNDGELAYAGPLVVLTSKLSASAAEIFSAAIRDCERGILVGDSRTFGKGTVLDVVSLDRYLKFVGKEFPAGSATFETAMFFRIAGGSVQQLGIASDIVLPSLTEQMEVGEMFMNNHLPWDSVKAVPFKKYTSNFDATVSTLKADSEKRVAADPEYRAFQRKVELYNKFKEKKSVSLNEATRWKEYQEEKQIQEEAEKIYEDKSSGKKGSDPVLKEAASIAAEFAGIEQK